MPSRSLRDNRRSCDVRIVDRRPINLDHLRHFGLPEILLEFRPARLGVDVVSRVTGGAIALYHLEIRPRLKCRGFVRKRVGTRSRVCRTESKACGGGSCEEKRTRKATCHDKSPHAAVTRTVSTTLRKYPGGFHVGSIGCVSPALLVARTLSS